MFFPQRETSGDVNNYNLNRELSLQETRYIHYTLNTPSLILFHYIRWYYYTLHLRSY